MLVLGVILLLIGLFVPAVHVLFVIGLILAVVGAILLVAGRARGNPYGGRYYY